VALLTNTSLFSWNFFKSLSKWYVKGLLFYQN
jgi:hypothetical protein